jgi:hypothetical protein
VPLTLSIGAGLRAQLRDVLVSVLLIDDAHAELGALPGPACGCPKASDGDHCVAEVIFLLLLPPEVIFECRSTSGRR